MRILDIISESTDHNFTSDDIKKLETISDLATAKATALNLITTKSKYPMNDEKVRWFTNQLKTKKSVTEVIEMMYRLLLSGEGHAVIGDRYSTKKSSYRDQFREEDEHAAVIEYANGEYDDEAGMAHSNLHTIARAAHGLLDTIDTNENLPEWAQEKIAKVEGMLVSVWDYLKSQEEQGIDPRIEESAAWHRKEGKNKKGGLNAKGVASYRREHPGSKLQTAVTTKPSKLKKGSKAAKRRKSFCARMGGVKGPMKKPNGEPTRKALALRKWNCESVEQTIGILEGVKFDLFELKQRLDPKCWTGYKKKGTKIKDGVRVNNCVPVNENDIDTEDYDYHESQSGMLSILGDLAERLRDGDIYDAAACILDLCEEHVKSGADIEDVIDSWSILDIDHVGPRLEKRKSAILDNILEIIQRNKHNQEELRYIPTVFAAFNIHWPEISHLDQLVSSNF